MSDSPLPPVTLPPVVATPPPSSPAPKAPEPRRGGISAWLIAGLVILGAGGLSIVVLVLFGWSQLNHRVQASAHHRMGASLLQEVVLADHDSKDKVAVIEISGVISDSGGVRGGSTPDSIRDQIDRITEDEHVKAVILRVDSPGGEVLASDEIYQALRALQLSNDIPVIASMGSIAASGGYYVSAPCRWIVAHPLTLTGSIGVIFHGYNYRGLMDKVGILPDVVKSGKLKDMFSGEQRPEDVLPEEKSILKDLVKESFDRFKQVIREGRAWSAEQNKADKTEGGHELAADWESIADGRILSGTQALRMGLVDELGDFDQAVARTFELAGLETANLVTYQSPPSFTDLLGLWGKAPSGKVQIEIPGLLPSAVLPQGRLYFVSPLHLH